MVFGVGEAAALLGGLGQAAGGAASLFGGGRQDNSWMSYVNAQQDREFQRAAMQNGIQWRVNDAQAAGIHPLYALGAPTFNPSATQVSADSFQGGNLGDSFANMGQGLSRAIAATQSKQQRELTIAEIYQREKQNEKTQAEIDLLQAQTASVMARTQRDQVGPGLPSGAVGGPLGVHKMDPAEVITGQRDTPTVTAGPPGSDATWKLTPSGVRPTVAKNSGVDDTDIFNPEYLEWAWRNKVFPNAARGPSPDYMARMFPGSIGAKWNQLEFEWQPIYPKGHYEKGRFVPDAPPAYPTPAYQRNR